MNYRGHKVKIPQNRAIYYDNEYFFKKLFYFQCITAKNKNIFN